MNKFIFLFLILFLLNDLTIGQDKIIRKIGDTINCTVTKIDSNIIYYKIRFHDRPINLKIDRNDIKDLIVPVLPDDPTYLIYKKNIKIYSAITTISIVSFVFGGTMLIYGFSESLVGIFSGEENTLNKGSTQIIIGIPLLVSGAVVGSISLKKAINYKKQLKKLNKLSIDMDYSPIYYGFTVCYKF
jgi:hypothetical protein